MRRTLLSALAALMIAASPASAHEDRLAGGEWVLDGSGARPPVLRFEAGRVSGTGGCNRFGGSYESDGATLSFSPLAATRMACPGEAMKTEQAFFDMLGKVKAMKLEGDRLDLLDGEGKVIGRFARQVAE